MSIKQIRLLKAKKGELYKELTEVGEELSKLENVRKVPELVKKYKGKYFKYHNSYGNDVKWWLYVHCTDITEDAKMLCTTFHVTPLDLIEIETGVKGEWLFQRQITKAEFTKALSEIKKLVNAL